MNARKKLNQAHVNGVLLIAGVIAAVGESWSLFWLLAAIFTALAVYSGDIRLKPEPRDRHKR